MDKTKINFKHTYDANADVLYVNFGDGEPTFVEELEDDFILLEIGWFTNLPKGIRVIGPKKHNLAHLNFHVIEKRIEKEFDTIFKNNIRQLKAQRPEMERMVRQNLGQLLNYA